MRIARIVTVGIALAACVCPIAQAALPFAGRAKEERSEERIQQELRSQLELGADQFAARFQRFIDLVLALEPPADSQTVRSAMTYRVRAVTAFRSMLRYPDARVVFLDMWAFSAQLERAITERRDLGRATEIAREMLRPMLLDLRDIGRTFLGEQELAEAERAVMRFAAEQPVGQRFSAFYVQKDRYEDLGTTVGKIIAAPVDTLNPFRGIDSTAASIHEAVRVGDEFTYTLAHLPETTLWGTELVLYDLRTSPEVHSLLASLEGFNMSAAGLEATARTLPQQVASELSATLARTEQTQASLRLTMEAARDTLDELGVALEQVQPALVSAERTTAHVAKAGVAWEATAVALREIIASFDDDPEPASQSGNEFDIAEYTEAASEIRAATSELNALVAAVQNLVSSDLPTLAATVDGSTRSAVDHVFFRVAELLLIGVASAVLMRAFWSRTRRVQPAA